MAFSYRAYLDGVAALECIQFGRQVAIINLRQEKPGLVAGANSLAFFISCGIAGSPVSAGFETCMFCLMLASRGAVYHTRKSTGEWKHFHRGCDCKVASNCAGSVDKTKAFEFALDFAPSNAAEVIHQLYGLIADNLLAYKDMGPAKGYEHLAGPMVLIRASPVVRPRICRSRNIGRRVFSLLSPIGWRVRLSWG